MTNPVACALRDAVIRAIPAGAIARLAVKINRRAGTDVRVDSVESGISAARSSRKNITKNTTVQRTRRCMKDAAVAQLLCVRPRQCIVPINDTRTVRVS